MSTYAIGDVQGCLASLKQLLEQIHYDPNQDTLWFTGDLINRGPDSLGTLRFIQSLPSSTICVLGNHDLALLAASCGAIELSANDTYQDILNAPDRSSLVDWLKNRPLFHHDASRQFSLAHAGIYPLWDLSQAQRLSKEVELLLRGPQYNQAMHALFGDLPNYWDDTLKGWDRFRFIVNAFTRMRFCNDKGVLELGSKGSTHQHLMPWFTVPNRKTQHDKVIIGHWAALQGKTNTPNVYALDTGCVWGNALTAICLETEQRFQVSCQPKAAF